MPSNSFSVKFFFSPIAKHFLNVLEVHEKTWTILKILLKTIKFDIKISQINKKMGNRDFRLGRLKISNNFSWLDRNYWRFSAQLTKSLYFQISFFFFFLRICEWIENGFKEKNLFSMGGLRARNRTDIDAKFLEVFFFFFFLWGSIQSLVDVEHSSEGVKKGTLRLVFSTVQLCSNNMMAFKYYI